jgi:aminopeptidase N
MGETIELVPGSLRLNGTVLEPQSGAFTLEPGRLIVHQPPSSRGAFTLESLVRLDPSKNSALEGLYLSGGNFCTQCEAEGFRRITPFIDRPDVMARYRTKIIADASKYPVLLSNGNLVEQGRCGPDHQLHFAVYEDPWPKPSYLFALVAGNLACVSDTFTRSSGVPVLLRIYVRHGDEARTKHAMESLKQAMRWDEQTYGREYDLDVFNIVAVDDFNMGAMENKSLNIFNSKYILASPHTATDADYNAIEAVVGHEYFHNWSGNRVTCRDWFQLSLKEGFTVFREQEFSADMRGNRAVKRIADVSRLRSTQFPQDAGPTAHPVRPDTYETINNFYSVTIYEKGAEVIRMMRMLLGTQGFRRGTDLYFSRHDGEAVTCDDFVAAMADANPDAMTAADWQQFKLWYSQAGTPEVYVRESAYDPVQRSLTIVARQRVPPTPGQPVKKPHVIPIATGILDSKGKEAVPTTILRLKELEQHFTLQNVPPDYVVSYLRSFSAPIKLYREAWSDPEREERELAFLMAHDTDDFQRWDAAQQLLLHSVHRQQGHLSEAAIAAFQGVFDRLAETDPLILAQILAPLSESYVMDEQPTDPIDPTQVHRACQKSKQMLAEALRTRLERILDHALESESAGEGFSLEAADQGRRALEAVAFSLLVASPNPEPYLQRALQRMQTAATMTTMLATLAAIVHADTAHHPYREAALSYFYERWHQDYLVMDKWLRIQATAPRADALDTVQRLVQHPAYNAANPNNIYSLLGGFALANPYGFHGGSDAAAAYSFLTDQIVSLDERNPQVAARLANAFTKWRRFDTQRQQALRTQMERILERPRLSKDVGEVISKCLGTEAVPDRNE